MVYILDLFSLFAKFIAFVLVLYMIIFSCGNLFLHLWFDDDLLAIY